MQENTGPQRRIGAAGNRGKENNRCKRIGRFRERVMGIEPT